VQVGQEIQELLPPQAQWEQVMSSGPKRSLAAALREAEEFRELFAGTGLVPVRPIAVPTERDYFELAGMAWREPEARL
jgi:hypothetical protein